jgi:hypothetical protein
MPCCGVAIVFRVQAVAAAAKAEKAGDSVKATMRKYI